MSGDIVERLRDRFRYGYPSWHQPCNEAMREAADEIELLRDALTEIAENQTDADACSICRDFEHFENHADASQMALIARRALEGTE